MTINRTVVQIKSSEIGEYSYIGEYSHISQHVTIGRYCSIGNLCTIGAQNHRIDRLTTWPTTIIKGQSTVIGNDVWIGCNCVVLSGISIGTGAVIGAGSVVTRNIPPYAIAYGNPARVMRFRFDEQVIADLLETRWWDLPAETVKSLSHLEIHECIKAMR